MKKFIFFLFLYQINYAQNIPEKVQKLLNYYPQIIDYKENKLFFKDGSYLIYDDFKTKSTTELIENPDIQNQFFYDYNMMRPICDATFFKI